MHATEQSPQNVLIVGWDWGEEQHALWLISPTGTTAQTLPHEPEAILAWAESLTERYPGLRVLIALEQSRGPVIAALCGCEGLELYPLNPRQLASYRDSVSPSGAKDDPGDARLLAEFLQHRQGRLRRWQPDAEETRRLGELSTLRRTLVEERKRLALQLTSSLKQYFPVILKLAGRALCSDRILDLLRRWPTLTQLKRVHPRTLRAFLAEHGLRIEDRPWQIGLIVGPFGCGKSTIARELFAAELVAGFDWPEDKALVDGFPKGMGIKEITQLLSSVGFSTPPAWLRPFRVLSNGEQFRATIARAMAEQPERFVVDEFTSVIDRTVAQVGSAAIAKAVRRRKGQQFVAVSCHYDIVDWLCPDWIFEPATGEFAWKESATGGPFRRPPIKLRIARCTSAAWRLFRHHHYLDHTLSKSARCFLGCVDQRPAVFTAVISFPHPTAPAWREHRTVCLPDFQGVGLGNAMSEFVASVFAATGKRYISTTSNPAMIQHRARSPNWNMHRKPSMVAAPGQLGLQKNAKNSWGRITAGFEYRGRPCDPETVKALLG